MKRRLLAMLLVFSLIATASTTAYAHEDTHALSVSSTELQDVITEILYTNELFNEIGIDLQDFVEIFDDMNMTNLDLFEDLDLFLESKMQESGVSQETIDTLLGLNSDLAFASLAASTTAFPSKDLEAGKAAAILHATECAEWNMQRDRNATTLEKETVYMYMSHYVDINGNYWEVMDPSSLHNGARMCEGSYYSRYITNDDRTAYEIYFTKLTYANMFDLIGTAGAAIASFKQLNFSSGELSAAIEAQHEVQRYASNFLLAADDLFVIGSTVKDAFKGSMDKFTARFRSVQTVDELWDEVYDNLTVSEVFDESTSAFVTSSIIKIGATVAGKIAAVEATAAIVAGLGPVIIVFTGKLFSTLLDRVAWLSLSIYRSMRIANRAMRYYGI